MGAGKCCSQTRETIPNTGLDWSPIPVWTQWCPGGGPGSVSAPSAVGGFAHPPLATPPALEAGSCRSLPRPCPRERGVCVSSPCASSFSVCGVAPPCRSYHSSVRLRGPCLRACPVLVWILPCAVYVNEGGWLGGGGHVIKTLAPFSVCPSVHPAPVSISVRDLQLCCAFPSSGEGDGHFYRGGN